MNDKEFLGHLLSELEYVLEENRDNVVIKGGEFDIDRNKMYKNLKFEDFLPGLTANNVPEHGMKQKNKGGAPKQCLAEAVEHICKKLPELGKTSLLKPSKIREFIILMKDMANKNNRHADEYVLERIKSIEIPEEGLCTIITHDQIKLKGQSETIVRGQSYTNNNVSKTISRLRKNNLISS